MSGKRRLLQSGRDLARLWLAAHATIQRGDADMSRDNTEQHAISASSSNLPTITPSVIVAGRDLVRPAPEWWS